MPNNGADVPPDPRPAAAFSLSIVIPVLNEASGIVGCLQRLSSLRAAGTQVIVVDGGSMDATVQLAQPHCDRVVRSQRGRAHQMNAGARVASGNVLLFLHSDTELAAGAAGSIATALADGQHAWGRFDVALSGRHPLFRLIESTMNLRSRWTGICTGDQGLFVTRAAFDAVGGFPDIALMEDVQMSARLRRLGAPCCLRPRVCTSSRRWERDGVLSTLWLMWRLRLSYFLGADPDVLARRYYGEN